MAYSTQTGQLWDVIIANASLTNTPDGQSSLAGHSDKIINDWLSDMPDQIKATFYNFYNRVKITAGVNLTLSYSGASLLINGQIIALPPGTIQATPNSTQFVYINNLGVVTTGLTLPNISLPLAIVTTLANTITQLVDLRDKVLEQIKPIALPVSISPFFTGDLKNTLSKTPQEGWLLCDGTIYLITAFPALAAVIGSQSLLVGDPVNSFRVPDFRQKVAIGAVDNTQVNLTVGQNSQVLSVANLPTHTHTINDPPHNHSISDPGHNHSVSDPGHNHPVFDPGHAHSLYPYRRYAEGNGTRSDGAELTQIPGGSNTFPSVQNANTGVSIGAVGTGIWINASASGISSNSNKSNVTVNNTGSNSQIDMRQAAIAVNVLIKT